MRHGALAPRVHGASDRLLVHARDGRVDRTGVAIELPGAQRQVEAPASRHAVLRSGTSRQPALRPGVQRGLRPPVRIGVLRIDQKAARPQVEPVDGIEPRDGRRPRREEVVHREVAQRRRPVGRGTGWTTWPAGSSTTSRSSSSKTTSSGPGCGLHARTLAGSQGRVGHVGLDDAALPAPPQSYATGRRRAAGRTARPLPGGPSRATCRGAPRARATGGSRRSPRRRRRRRSAPAGDRRTTAGRPPRTARPP